MKTIKKILIVLIIIIFCVIGLTTNIFRARGESMEPTIHNNSLTLFYKYATIERNDIVSLVTHEAVIKRIVGLPGETISCKDNIIYINGNPLEESYLDETFVEESIKEHGFFTPDFDEITLGDDEYYYLGDNRPESGDSTEYGPCHKNQIEGKLIFKIKL